MGWSYSFYFGFEIRDEVLYTHVSTEKDIIQKLNKFVHIHVHVRSYSMTNRAIIIFTPLNSNFLDRRNFEV